MTDMDQEPRSDSWAPDWTPSGRTGAPSRFPPLQGAAYAEFPLRVIAFVVDLLLLNLLTGLVSQLVSVLHDVLFGRGFLYMLTTGRTESVVSTVAFMAGASVIAASAIYFWCVFRATPGQMMLGLFVVRRGSGTALSTQAAFLRWLLLYVPWVVFISASWLSQLVLSDDPLNPADPNAVVFVARMVPLAWYALLAASSLLDRRRGRGLHDLAAGSIVIRRAGSPS